MQNNQKIKDSFLLAEKILQNVSLQIVKKLETQLNGDYSSIFHGHGLDFKEIREYTLQDDIRTVDWNVTARMNEPHVRVYSEEKELITWLILDISPSMDFGSDLISKKETLIQFSALIAYIAAKRGDKTGAIFFNNDIEEIIKPAKGIKQAYSIIQKLLTIQPKNTNPKKQLDLSKIKNLLGKKKVIFFVSDFIFPDFSWENAFGEINIKNELTAVQIIDPLEENLPNVGYVNLLDPETGKKILIDTSNTKLMSNYRKLLEEENKKTEKIFEKSKIKPVKIFTNSDIAEVLINHAHKIPKTGGRIA